MNILSIVLSGKLKKRKKFAGLPFLILFLILMSDIAGFAQIQTPDTSYQRAGVKAKLPVFAEHQAKRLSYPFSWLSGKWVNFNEWRSEARKIVFRCLLSKPPVAPFNPAVIAEEDRGTYIARKVVFNLTADSRVLSYLLVPKGKGPFPAVLLLHDHGARFDIGKEKVIEPFGCYSALRDTARMWVNQLYGGRFIGDELARRGYVCFATDALNWGDRGGGGYEDQQALASNLFNLGMSYAGIVAWEDMQSAEFLASLPFVDSDRISAVGFSFGAFRAWQISALSDRIACGVAVCWMGTNHGLLQSGNNRTRGQSAFSTTHPDLSNYLDFPDVASIACPKPMLFMNGTKDKLFPVETVLEAYDKMCFVWQSQGMTDRLQTELWDVGHVFTVDMQERVLKWLDKYLMISY